MGFLDPKPQTTAGLDAAMTAKVNDAASGTRGALNATYASKSVETSKADASTLTAHTGNTSNPHAVTKAQIGLGNADNTADTSKPVSTAQAAALAAKLDVTTAATTYAPLRTFHAANYASLSALFTARNAYSGPAVIELSSDDTYSAANLRIDKADTTLVGHSALITLPAGANQDVIKIHPDAMRVRIQNVRLAGNYANQTGTSRGIVFEEYTDAPFRYADRASVEDCNIDGFLHDGIVIEPKRLHVVIERTFIRDFGRYGVDINSSDCRVLDSAIGGIRGTHGIRVNAGANWVKGMGVYSCTTAGIWLTDKAVGCKIEGNDLDNNMGNGLRAVGTTASALFTSIIGNHFRANSTAGDGISSDIYLDQVTDVMLAGNFAFQQPGSTNRTKYVVEAGTGVASIFEYGNGFQSTYPTVSRWNTAATTARLTRHASLALASDGTSDVAFTRSGNGVQVSNDFTSAGTLLGAVLSITGTGGSGFAQFIEQSSDAAVPSADRARVFAKDNGAGKTQLCVRFATGAVQVIATEP
jgi:hypothetical protein